LRACLLLQIFSRGWAFSSEGFGGRLAQIRESHGLTQAELAVTVGVSRRVIAYYEPEDSQPPGAMLVDLAKALRVSTDQLLGLKPSKDTTSPRAARVVKRLQRIAQLPASERAWCSSSSTASWRSASAETAAPKAAPPPPLSSAKALFEAPKRGPTVADQGASAASKQRDRWAHAQVALPEPLTCLGPKLGPP
jgi:transcriptional regulator with XRE-family HTH domain